MKLIKGSVHLHLSKNPEKLYDGFHKNIKQHNW